jgi:hypothetical protein
LPADLKLWLVSSNYDNSVKLHPSKTWRETSVHGKGEARATTRRLQFYKNRSKAKTPAATKLPPALFETVAGGLEPRLL